jgi:integrase
MARTKTTRRKRQGPRPQDDPWWMRPRTPGSGVCVQTAYGLPEGSVGDARPAISVRRIRSSCSLDAGGLELPLKLAQARLGHASIQMTADIYGHLFPRGDDGAELAAAERALVLHTV